jgi:general secretion pathway protein G
LNSSYDLFSAGKDGNWVAPITAAVSQDDIIRANDGAYVGLASEY